MSYSIFWKSYGAGLSTQKDTPIVVAPGVVVSNAASLRLTGKGAANYGLIQQENLLRLLENFADSTAPLYPTIGQTWYDTQEGAMKVCISTAPQPTVWRSLNATQVTDVGDPAPSPAVLGDTWFQRTGSNSGVLYVYTGLGRFPAVDWDATAAGYFPATSTDLGAVLNSSVFGASGTDYGEAYIHGYTASVAADVDGSIVINSVPTVVPKGALYTQFPVTNGYVMWDQSGTLVSLGGSSHFFSVRQLTGGEWQYDNDSTWVTFEPTSQMIAIGQITVSEQDDNTAAGITSITLWSTGDLLSKYTQVPMTATGGAIGGWAQIWPAVDAAAAREEYDYMIGLLAQLIGDEIGFGGGGMIGRSVQYLTSIKTLDASLRLAWAAGSPIDTNVLNSAGALGELTIDPMSADWDAMLAATKYAVNRLELPSGMVDDVSDLPFTQDGRQAPANILAFTGVMAPSDRRKAVRRVGSITLSRLYQETVNVLNAAILNRYVLKGMLGNSGTNTAFDSNVSVDSHAGFTANATGTPFSSTVSHGIDFRFDYTRPELERFFTAGQAIEIIVRHTPSGSPTIADTDLKTTTDTYGRFRVTNDSTYVMDSSVSPSLTQAPGSVGFSGVSLAGTTLGTASSGGATLTCRAQLIGGGVVRFFVDVLAGGATTGSLSVSWNLIVDNETYNAGLTRVFPIPSAYTGTDQQGSVLFV